MPKPSLAILYRDAHLVAIDKPAGLAVIPGRGETDSVLERLARQLGIPHAGRADPRVRVVHRLDKDTSGVVLYATDVEAQRHLSHQFQNNAGEKEYLAVVRGRPAAREGEIDAPLAPHPNDPKRMAVAKKGGRPAVTRWRVEQTFREYALLRCFPKTGKTHQIRVHLHSIGLPLAVDPLYNPRWPGTGDGLMLSSFKKDYSPTRGQPERPLIARLTLHAEKLSFQNLDDTTVTIEAPPPKDFRAAVNQLSRHARP